MRLIKTENIKVEIFPMAIAKKDAVPIAKNEFLEELESFLAKDTKTEKKSDESEEVVTNEEEALEVKEKEEEFNVELAVNLMDLSYLGNQPIELKTDAEPAGEIIDLQSLLILGEKTIETNSNNLEKNKVQQFKLDDLLSENVVFTSDNTSNPMDLEEVEGFLVKLENQLIEKPELEVQDVIEELLSENESELGNSIQNIDTKGIEINSQVESEFTLPRLEPSTRTTKNIEVNNNHEINEMADLEIKETVSIEKIEIPTESKDSDLTIEDEVKVQAVELSSVEIFEPVNREDFTTETSTPIQSMPQEDFVSNIETLMIEETESISSGDKVTTARIQLTPERLGKVDLQIEINGKELTAKLIVEQKETKEWIDQQVAHLKEKLLTQEIAVKDFQVVVHEENLNDAFMNSGENPFFKQKEKDSQARKEQRLSRRQAEEVPIQREEITYSTRNSISILV